jgi:hypothetical protein
VEIKVGDKVKVIADHLTNHVGREGKVVAIQTRGKPYRIEIPFGLTTARMDFEAEELEVVEAEKHSGDKA